MDRVAMQARTKALALRILKLLRSLPREAGARAIANQIVRSGTSVGANYRASGRARSRAEFLAKLGTVEEEADETCYWLELIIEDGLLPRERVDPLLQETQEIVAMIVAARKSTRAKSVRS